MFNNALVSIGLEFGCRAVTLWQPHFGLIPIAAAVIRQPYRFRLFHDRETVLADAAKRAFPIVRNGLKRGAGGNTAVGVALLWVVNITADVANVLFFIF